MNWFRYTARAAPFAPQFRPLVVPKLRAGGALPSIHLTKGNAMLRSTHRNAGFSLLELMIVVAVIGILSAIALPSYNEYVTRGKIQEATAALSDMRTKMEAYYMDNRRYSSTAGGGTCGIPGGNTPTVAASKYFTYACASSSANASGDQAYTLTATGVAAQGMNGFVLTIDQSNTKRTTGVGTGWTVPASNCWVQKKNGSC